MTTILFSSVTTVGIVFVTCVNQERTLSHIIFFTENVNS